MAVDVRQQDNAAVTAANGGDWWAGLNSVLGTVSSGIVAKLDLERQIAALRAQSVEPTADNNPNASPTAVSGDAAVDSFARWASVIAQPPMLLFIVAVGITVYLSARD